MNIMRRVLAFFVVAAAPFALPVGSAADKKPAAGQYVVYVGTYTTKTESKGINTFRFDAATGKMTPAQVAAESPDPSFVAVHPSGKYLYAVNEAGKSSVVSAFAIDGASKALTLLNQLPALGEDPCYISFDRTGKFALIANYSAGNIAVFPILSDGKLGRATAAVQDSGTLGPNKERQEGPHAHWIEASPDNRFLLVADLGLDEVLIYRFDAVTGSVAPNQPAFARLKAGAGPRHAAFDRNGKFVFVASEMDSTITSFSWDAKKGALKQTGAVSTLPAGYSGRNEVAEIALHPNGKFLYVSNRGNESIAVFAIHPGNGALTLVAHVPTGGKEPRHFAIDPSGQFLVAENQLSDNIVEFRIDAATGKLTATGAVVSVPSPVCVTFAAAK
ncbi:MAG TPA: lactonase family protein [Candidatus Dormibacteraeota bacterium]|nr:lactonase family protein [Candidatus Dormibacteraeota bacterium]